MTKRKEPNPRRCMLRRITINGQGYDARGAYWGHGSPLWYVTSDDGTIDEYFRAPSDRAAAKAHVVRHHPRASFYR